MPPRPPSDASAGPMLRVLLLSTDLERGGFPLGLRRIAPRLPAFGVQPIVGCLAPPGPVGADLRRAGIETFSCDARNRFDAACLARLAAHVRRIDPDLIHAGLFHANLAARLVGRLDRQRPIITSTVTIEIERGWHRWLEALTVDASDLHVANSEAVAEHLRRDLGFDPARIVVIPNGVDLDLIERTPPARRSDLGIPDDAPLIAWVGRMDPVKDLPFWVRVFGRLRERGEASALLIGDGAERSAVRSAVERAGLAGVVHMPGWRENVAEWLKAADAFLFTSQTEGSPNAVIEAMAAGCPVVARDLPACRDLIETGRHGLLFGGDDPDAVAGVVHRMLTDAALRARCITAARNRVLESHAVSRVTPMTAALYRRVTDRNAVR